MRSSSLRALLAILGLLLVPSSGAIGQVIPAAGQCVSTASAGGTASAMTISQLPCVPTSTLAVISAIGPNVSTTPTLQMTGQAALTILRQDGTALQIGDITSGMLMLLENNGVNWFLLNPATGPLAGNLSGDVTGTSSTTVVGKVNGASLGTTTASSGNLLVGSGSAWVTKALSGDGTLTSGGALTIASIGGKSFSVGTTGAAFNGGGTLSVTSGKTLTATKSLTLAGTDATTLTGPSASATLLSTNGAASTRVPANPAGTTSLVGVMMGLGADTAGGGANPCTITPKDSSRVRFAISGVIVNNTANDGANGTLRFGTGTAPANGAALTGTILATPTGVVNNASTAAFSVPIFAQAIQVGLVPGTPYWFDFSLASVTGGTSQVANITCSSNEQ